MAKTWVLQRDVFDGNVSEVTKRKIVARSVKQKQSVGAANDQFAVEGCQPYQQEKDLNNLSV